MLIERPLTPVIYLIKVNNCKTIIIPNDSLIPAYTIVVAQEKPQLKDQIQLVIPFKLTVICMPTSTCCI